MSIKRIVGLSITSCLLLLRWVSASCIGPAISLSVANAAQSEKITVVGHFFTDGCHDVCINGVCPPTFPAKGIKIFFMQGTRMEEVARVDANEKFEFSTIVVVPSRAEAGKAAFFAETLYEGSALRTRSIDFTVATKSECC